MKSRFLLLIALVLAASPALAQNMLGNPNFHTDLNFWSGVSFAQWDNTLDNGGNTPTHGSNRGTMPISTPSSAGTQCLLVSASSPYSYGGMVHVNDALMSANFMVWWFASTNCLGSVLSTIQSPSVTTTGSWIASNGANPVTSPPTAQSALFVLQLANTSAIAPGSVNFDDVFFGPGASPVSLQRFSAE